MMKKKNIGIFFVLFSTVNIFAMAPRRSIADYLEEYRREHKSEIPRPRGRVDLSNQGINSLDGIEQLTFAKHINLSGNHITGWPANLELRNLRVLDLSDNNIIQILPRNFNLPELRLLILNKNNIGRIEADAFVGSLKLQMINLSENNLIMPNINPGAFNGVNNLQKLIIKENRLGNVSRAAFLAQFPSLEGVNVDYNPQKEAPMPLGPKGARKRGR